MKSHHPFTFYNALQTIRLTASVIYDQGLAQEMKPAQLAQAIQPLHEQKQKMIERALETDLGGLICAIRQLNEDAKSHIETIKFLKEKAHNAELHSQDLMNAIKEHLKKNGVTEAMHGDFSVTLIGETLTIR